MKFCIQHGAGDPNWVPGAILAPRAVTAFAQAAEQSGWSGLGFTDHPAPSGRWVDAGGEGVADPFSSLGFCAAVTSTIRLFTFVLVPAYRNPFLTAHQVATLDHLSAGRLTLALGTGYLKSEFRSLGVDPDGRLRKFEETVAIMQQAWRGEDVTLETATFSARDTRMLPPVVQQPHPPLWVHGNGRWGTEWAARHGQGWLGMIATEQQVKTIRTTPLPDITTLAARIDDVRVACERNGRDPGSLVIAAAGAWPMLDVRDGLDVDASLARVAALEAIGVDWVMANCCGDDASASIDTVRQFGEQIIGPSSP